MIESWLLRKQIEAKIIAGAIAELFQPQPEKPISAGELFALMGITPKVAPGAEWPGED
jgi:hypothetical protein